MTNKHNLPTAQSGGGRSKKEVILIIGFFVLIVLSIFMVRYVGHVIQTIPSSVIIDEGIRVLDDSFLESESSGGGGGGGGTSDSTTDFLHMNDTELADIENMILITDYGKIIFSDNIDLTQDVKNNVIDLNSNIELSDNFIEINTTALTSLEKPATLYLTGLDFENPRILRNGEICPASICQEVDYSGGILEFTTTSFSNYSTEETPSAPSETPAPSNGGSGSSRKMNFEVEPKFITITLFQEQGKSFDLQIKNTGNRDINITAELQNLDEISVLSEQNFILSVGETKTIKLDLFALSKTNPKIYFGKLIVKGDSIQKIVNIVVEVKAREPLFDLKINVPQEYKQVSAGDKIPILVQMKNIGLYGTAVDVGLYIYIMDFNEKILFESSKEVVAVKTNLSIVRELKAPLDAPVGKYLVIGKMEYGEEFDSITIEAHDSFDIVEKEFPIIISEDLILAIIIIIIFVIGIIYYIKTHYHIKKKKRKNKAFR